MGQASAPDLYSSMGFPGVGVGTSMTGNSAAPPSAAPASTTNPTSPTSSTPATPSSGTIEGNQQAYNQLMQQMITSMAGQGINNPPEERFRTQLETLASLGFVDRPANIQALVATYGDVNAAIDRLLNSRPSGEQS